MELKRPFSSGQGEPHSSGSKYTHLLDPDAGETVLQILPKTLLVRPGAYFSPWSQQHFLGRMFELLASGKPFLAAEDQTLSPTYLPDLVNASLDLFLDREYGIWHLANQGEVSWAEFGKLAARQAGLNLFLLEECPSEEMDYLAPRPQYSALTSQRGIQLPPLEEAVADYVRSTVFA
jgi:dTDP-4-dehydrorhamnose reductase